MLARPGYTTSAWAANDGHGGDDDGDGRGHDDGDDRGHDDSDDHGGDFVEFRTSLFPLKTSVRRIEFLSSLFLLLMLLGLPRYIPWL